MRSHKTVSEVNVSQDDDGDHNVAQSTVVNGWAKECKLFISLKDETQQENIVDKGLITSRIFNQLFKLSKIPIIILSFI